MRRTYWPAVYATQLGSHDCHYCGKDIGLHEGIKLWCPEPSQD